MAVLNFFKRRKGPSLIGEEGGQSVFDSGASGVNPVSRVSPYGAPQEEATQEGVYTHGFESIYKLQNVDVRTVRPMGASDEIDEEPVEPEGDLSPRPKLVVKTVPELLEDQLLLDLGDEYRGWIQPFRLSEPIRVLGLSSVAEKGFYENGKEQLKDLLDIDPRDFSQMKGVGQGHVVEMAEKLEVYLEGYPRERADRIDFCGLLLCLLGAQDRKAAHLWLQEFGLGDLLPLSSADLAEVRHHGGDQSASDLEALKVEMSSEKWRRFVADQLALVLRVFVRPWLWGRSGLASEGEIRERLERVSRDGEHARRALDFLSQVYFEGKSPFSSEFIEVEPGVFAADGHVAKAFRAVRDCSKTYFYSVGMEYPLQELERFLLREFALKWEGFHLGFAEKVLRISPHFSTWKNQKQQVMVKVG